jgi:predicted transcriptional regulator
MGRNYCICVFQIFGKMSVSPKLNQSGALTSSRPCCSPPVNMTSKPPFPCILNPNPRSILQPGIQCRQDSFFVQSVPAAFPYETQTSADNRIQIHHLIIDGQGPPPDDVGHPGDIYFDYINSGILDFDPLVLYARTERSWLLWPGKDLGNILQHPHLPDYFLWHKKKSFGWTHARNIEGWAKTAAETAKRKRAEVAAKRDWETFGVALAPDGLSLSVNLSVTETESLRTFLKEIRTSHKRARDEDGPDQGPRKRTKKYRSTLHRLHIYVDASQSFSAVPDSTPFSELMVAAMHDADAMYAENKHLKVEVDRLNELLEVRDKTIQVAQGLAEENANLHQACQTLIHENSKMKEEAQIVMAKLLSGEKEIMRLNEERDSPSIDRFMVYQSTKHADRKRAHANSSHICRTGEHSVFFLPIPDID